LDNYILQFLHKVKNLQIFPMIESDNQIKAQSPYVHT
jgi:hypothetical protein